MKLSSRGERTTCMPDKILVIEDEPALQELLRFHLKESGYEVLATDKGREGFSLARKELPSLILLDLMLPDLDGTEVCRLLKHDGKTRKIPIMILTAKGEEIDKVIGFELGAEDYVTKPFSPRELLLRIKAILKRSRETDSPARQFRFGPLEVDATKPKVLFKGKEIPMTPVELKLLLHLYSTRGHVQSREVLLDRVWGYNSAVTTRTVDVHVKRLREKLGSGNNLIETIRGLGYRFREKP